MTAIESFVIMSHQQDVETQHPPVQTDAAQHSAAADSGFDAGSSSEFDQINKGEHDLKHKIVRAKHQLMKGESMIETS